MPSRANRSSVNCCTSRTPPSPDGEPPRLAVSPVKTPQRSVNVVHECRKESKELTEPKKTKEYNPPEGADTALIPVAEGVELELDPIFENGNARAVSGEPEITPARQASTLKLRSLLLGDKSDTDEEWEQIKLKKSSSTLSAVKQKLKKHLSRETTLSKRRSVSSVGTTDKEIERRAELKRIRHKRIQLELSNEASYDEDAKSLSSIADADTTLGTTINSSWKPREAIPLPRRVSPSLSYPSYPFPAVAEGPSLNEQNEKAETDAIKAEVSPDKLPQIDTIIGTSSDAPKKEDRTISRSSGTISQRHSSPILHDGDSGHFGFPIVTCQQERKLSEIPPIPPAPVIEPKRLASIPEPTRSSWRLSFVYNSNSNQEYKIPIPATIEETTMSGPTLRRWLHGQGLRSSSNPISNLDNKDISKNSSNPKTPACPVPHDVSGVDGGTESDLQTPHLHQMGISHRLASRTLMPSPSSPELIGWGSVTRADSSSDTSLVRIERSRFLRNTSDSIALSGCIPQSWGNVLQDQTSSHYPSTGNSIQPSAESSRFNLASILASSMNSPAASEIDKLEFPNLEKPLTIATTASDTSPSRPLPLTRQPRKTAFDDSSLLVSETESFREREAELSIVKTRFASAEARRSPSTPVSSKFREEFDLEPKADETSVPRKSSRFGKLAKFAIKSYDGPSSPLHHSKEELLTVPVPGFNPKPSGQLQKTEDPMGGSWGGSRGKRRGLRRRKGSDEPKTVFAALMMKRKKDPKSDKNGESDDNLEAKDVVMDLWEDEMAAIAGKAKMKSKNIVKKKVPTGPDLRFPPSWSRFPSHSRHERSFSAGRPENVEARDFAMTIAGNGEPTWYLHERKHHLYHYEGDDHPSHADDARKKGVVEKVAKKLKEEIKNYQNAGEPPEIEDTFGRRSSLNPTLHLDRPELEILPMELRSAAQMEQEVMEQLAEQKRLDNLADMDMGTVDGSVDEDNVLPRSVSIADPKFYDECLVHSNKTGWPKRSESKKGKYRTWSAKDLAEWDGSELCGSVRSGCGSGRRRRKEVSLRKSTDDYHAELKEMERLEREKVLRVVEEVWGRKKGKGKSEMVENSVKEVSLEKDL
ncbi:hypothetical protein HYALB_00012618 [Hymenoscyphus albidus]|uniref:Uncharacterized protein n=1 Tax=Hymenoscyphus albidus TaxID=595503 RepID=A0A9N9LUN0_9HELO|nr:hypothetical protein HYALB_00012618 [Hymenoscyphus albidus]